MKTSALRFAAVAALIVGFAATAAAYVDETLDPSIGWVVTDETKGHRIAEERLTPEQEEAGVKPWQIMLGGDWNSAGIATGSTSGDNTTLDLSKKFWRPSTKSILKMGASIAGSAFKGYTTIKKLLFFADETYLVLNSKSAHFSGCTGLVEISPFLPKWMKNVPDSAFEGCTSLGGDIVMPEGASVGTYTFRNTAVGSLTIGSKGATNLVSIGKQAFAGCSSLTNVTILTEGGWKTVTTTSGAGENFKDCKALMNFTMMSFPTEMQASAFPVQTASKTYAANKYKICFFVPAGIADPNGLLTDGITPWAECEQAAKDAYAARWPGAPAPLGVIKDTQPSGSYHYGTYALPAYQFVANIPEPGFMVIVR